MVKRATNQNGESQDGDMPERRQTVNDVTARASSRMLYCGHSTQYSHLVTVCKCHRQVEISANRTPLMTSESAANHGTSLYGRHDNRATPAACGENKRLFRGVYDERKSTRQYCRLLLLVADININ